jgi:biopolymer transport protein ExbD
MAVKSSDDNKGLITDINITPFVDIVLVLLIAFMISAPVVVQNSLGIKLPPAVTAQNKDHITLHFFIMPDKSLKVEGKNIVKDQIPALLQRVKAANPDFDVVVSADMNVPHGTVLELIDMIRYLGTTEVGIGTTQKK